MQKSAFCVRQFVHSICPSYSPGPVQEYTEVEIPSSPLSSTDEMDEVNLSEMHPVLIQDGNSYALEVRPLIRTDITPFVNLNDRLLPPDVDPKLRFNGNACADCRLNDEFRPFVKCS